MPKIIKTLIFHSLLLGWLNAVCLVSAVHFVNERRLEHDVKNDVVTDVVDLEFERASEHTIRVSLARILRETGCSHCQRLVPKSKQFEKQLVADGWDLWYRCDCRTAARNQNYGSVATATAERNKVSTGRGTFVAIQRLKQMAEDGSLGLVGLHTVSPEYKAQQAEWTGSKRDLFLDDIEDYNIVWATQPSNSKTEDTMHAQGNNSALRGSLGRALKHDKKEKKKDKKKEDNDEEPDKQPDKQPDTKPNNEPEQVTSKTQKLDQETLFIPNDAFLEKQKNFEIINLYAAWGKMASVGWGGDNEAIVHVMDSGIQKEHEDIGVNMWTNKGENCDNGKDDDGNGYRDDCHGWNHANDNSQLMGNNEHGTHVCGIIAADTNNGKGVAGIVGGGIGSGRGAELMIGVAFGYDSVTGGFVQSLIYAANHKATVSTNSWTYTYPGLASKAVLNAIDYAVKKDVAVVFAAGNHASAADFYPSFHHNVMAVSATDNNKKAAYFTNYGKWIDVTCPGVDIFSTGYATNQYVKKSGTSFSTPHVAGVLAMGRKYKPSASVNELKSCLLSSADEIGNIQPNQSRHGGNNLGYGMVNAHAFLECLDKPNTCGNGVIEKGEVCDWFALGSDISCKDLGSEFIGGRVRCPDCQGFDFSGCMKTYMDTPIYVGPGSEVVVSVNISPPKTGLVVARLSGGSGSSGANLYVSKNAVPTVNNHHCQSASENLNNEHCTLSGAGLYRILVHNEDKLRGIQDLNLVVFADGAR